MNRAKNRSTDSLLSITIKYIAENIFEINNLTTISQLPNHLKERILHIFTTSKWFWRKIDFKTALRVLVNKNVRHMNLTGCVVDDEVLRIIAPCVNLRSLHLTSCEGNTITTEALFKLIPRLPLINRLYLSHCEAVNDEVIECLVQYCPYLEALDVGRCSQLTDKSLKALAELEGLIFLTYSYTQVTDAGIEHLVRGKSGSELRELRVSQCLNISEKILKPIGTYCGKIEVLIFHNCQKINDQTCFSFEEGSLKNLKQLNWTIEW